MPRVPLVLTVVFFVLFFGGAYVYQAYQGPLEGQIAVKQADGTNTGAAVGAFVGRHDIPSMIRWSGIGLIGLTWAGHYLLRDKLEDKKPQDDPSNG